MSQQKNQDIRGGAPPDRPRQDSTDLPASNARDADARREHREAPGSLDIGRKGGASKQTKEYPHTGRSSHH